MAVSASEVEFFAEDSDVEIVPRFQGDVLKLLSGGSVGPFIPQTPLLVPLWLAVVLKKQNKCTIRTPEWLRKDSLKAVKMNEKSGSINQLQLLPDHYIEVASILLEHCSSEMEDASEVRSILEDIENLRQHKIRRGLQEMAKEQTKDPLHHLKLNNASAMEVNSIRPLLLKTLEEFFKLYNEGADAIMKGKQYREGLEQTLEEQEEAAAAAHLHEQEQQALRLNGNRTHAPASGESQDTHITQTQDESDDDEVFLKSTAQDDMGDEEDGGLDLRGR